MLIISYLEHPCCSCLSACINAWPSISAYCLVNFSGLTYDASMAVEYVAASGFHL